MRKILTARLNVKVLVHDAVTGALLSKREGHNVWLDQGRTAMAQILSYNMAGYPPVAAPPDPEPVAVLLPRLPFFVGVGIGGNQQSGPIPGPGVGTPDTDYPGNNIQSDADPTVRGLERPVRAALNVGVWARWVRNVVPSLPGATPYWYTRYTAVFLAADINTACTLAGGDYATVPVSEAALYLWQADQDQATLSYPPALPFIQQEAIAYFTFPPIPKTNAATLTVQWDLIYV